MSNLHFEHHNLTFGICAFGHLCICHLASDCRWVVNCLELTQHWTDAVLQHAVRLRWSGTPPFVISAVHTNAHTMHMSTQIINAPWECGKLSVCHAPPHCQCQCQCKSQQHLFFVVTDTYSKSKTNTNTCCTRTRTRTIALVQKMHKVLKKPQTL